MSKETNNYTLISQLQKEYEKNKLNADGSVYADMLQREYVKALNGLFDVSKIYRTADNRYKVRTPIQVCRTRKIDVLEAVYAYYFAKEENPTVKDIYDMWIVSFENTTKLGHRSYDTLDRYRSDWIKYFEGSTLAQTVISEVKMSTLKQHYEKITAHEAITRKALSNAKSLMNHIFDYAIDNDYVTQNLARNVNTRDLICKEVDNEEKVYSDDERQAVMAGAAALDNSYSRAITTMFCLCARVGEIKALKWEDIDFKNRTINIHSSMRRTRNAAGKQEYVYTNTTKGRKKTGQRVEPMSDTAFKVLKKQRCENPFGEYVFTDNGHALDTTQFNRWLKRICTSVGVAYLSSQKIRFSAVTRMHDSGIPLSKIQKIAGHATPSTTEGYIRNKKSPTLSLEPWNELFN